MTDGDKRLRQDLEDAFDGDDPGAEFDQRVLADIDGGGGEHEISAFPAPARKGGRWYLVVGVAAAAVLLAMLFFGPFGGSKPTVPSLAGGEYAAPVLELPTSETTGEFKAQIRIWVTKDGEVMMAGRTLDWPGLTKALAARAKEIAGPMDSSVGGRPGYYGCPTLVCADRRVRWRVIQWVLQTCAGPEIRLHDIALAVRSGDRQAALPTPLPTDLGVGIQVEKKPILTVALKRKKGESHTRVGLFDSDIGVDRSGFTRLRERASMILASHRDVTVAEIDAAAWVPLGDVVRAIDLLRQAGIKEVRFVGAPPPNADRLSDEPFRRGDETLPFEEHVIEEAVIEEAVIEEGKLPPGKIAIAHLTVKLRLRDGKPELQIDTFRGFVELSKGLKNLSADIRSLKRQRIHVKGYVISERAVPWSVVTRVLENLRKAGVTEVELK